VVSFDDLTVSYRQHPALHHVSGRLARGSLTAVVGPNGAGKSTLLKATAGLLPCAPGCVQVDVPPERVAYLPQMAEIDRGFPMLVRECVLLGCWPRTGPWGGVDAGQWRAVDQAVAEVGLAGFGDRPIGSLSTGQLQRVMFARLMVQDAELILLDEPFNAMDSKTMATLISLVRRWHGEGRTVVAVLHDDALVHAHFPETMLLARECIAWGPTAQVMTAERLARARGMAEAWDEQAGFCAPPRPRPPSFAPGTAP
jgi:zinc/manganese transport system ATP-binding protein